MRLVGAGLPVNVETTERAVGIKTHIKLTMDGNKNGRRGG